MDSNYISIEEYTEIDDNEVYDYYPSRSNVKGWDKKRRGADVKPRFTLRRLLDNEWPM